MKKELLEWIFCIVIALALALLVRYFVGTPTIVKHESMYPTLQENQRLILNRMFRISVFERKCESPKSDCCLQESRRNGEAILVLWFGNDEKKLY